MIDPEAALPYDRDLLTTVLVYHWRTDTSGCGCGWAKLGASHPEHVADVYEDSCSVRDAGLKPGVVFVEGDGSRIYPASHDTTATCPDDEHTYGWHSDDALYCECGVPICGQFAASFLGQPRLCSRTFGHVGEHRFDAPLGGTGRP